MSPLTRRETENRRAPIAWSPDNKTVRQILDYCEGEVDNVRRKRSKLQKRRLSTHGLDAREAILTRIHGNLCNANHRAYPSEVCYATVARELTRDIDDTQTGQARKTGYLTALDSEWDTLHAYFARNFTKHDLD